MSKKHISVKFVDMSPGFEPNHLPVWGTLLDLYDITLSDEPEYLFYSCFSSEHLDPKYDGCIKICWLGENITPDFDLCDYAVGFDWLTFGDRYFRYPEGTYLARRPEFYHRETRNAAQENRTRFCSFVYSNTLGSDMRMRLLKALNQYKPVDCGGKIQHNVDIPSIPGKNRFEERLEFERNYRFSIACENSSHPGYMTEKLLVSFAAGTIPIYWGDPEVKRVINPEAFLCVSDYLTLDDLVRDIAEIDQDAQRYQHMITAPVFLDPDYYQNMQDGVIAFLCHIFDQDIADAVRRNSPIMYTGEKLNTLRTWKASYEREQASLFSRVLRKFSR